MKSLTIYELETGRITRVKTGRRALLERAAARVDQDTYGLLWCHSDPSRHIVQGDQLINIVQTDQDVFEIRRAEVRRQRDAYLAATDWTQAPDAPVDSQAWAAWREELRDVDSLIQSDGTVSWPKRPVIEQANLVKAEAARRIFSFAPPWRQMNAALMMADLSSKPADQWSDREAKEWQTAQDLRRKIDAVRSASNLIENMQPRPEDIRDDDLWPDFSEN